VIGVVVDSNVYISALVFGCVPQRLLDLIFSREFDLCISPSIIEEVTAILASRFGWADGQLTRFLPPLWARCTLTKPSVRLKVCVDPDDYHVLECAEAANARYLITGNSKHFPKTHKTTRILSPRQFLDLVSV
jgi:putative PIN family toxin of toxin-antitoxin system